MKTIKTKHVDVGYTENLEVVERALREKFGCQDNSYVLLAVAAHIWATICQQSGEEKEWTSIDVLHAITSCGSRLQRLAEHIKETSK